MFITEQLILNAGGKIIGFAGGKGRDFVVGEISSRLSRNNQKVVISHLETEMVPGNGHLILDESETGLVEQIESSIDKEKVVYAGKKSIQGFVTGINESTAKKIAGSAKVDLLFLFVGPSVEYTFISPQSIKKIADLRLLNRLIYFFQLDAIDQQLDNSLFESKQDFLKLFPAFKLYKRFTHRLFQKYLTHTQKGLLPLFKQTWPLFLVFTDIHNILLESKAINLSRDIFSKGMNNLFYLNLKENLLKKVPLK